MKRGKERVQCQDHEHDCPYLAKTLEDLREENARLRAAVELALELAENELVDFKRYGLEQDSDIPAFYHAALDPEVK